MQIVIIYKFRVHKTRRLISDTVLQVDTTAKKRPLFWLLQMLEQGFLAVAFPNPKTSSGKKRLHRELA